MRDAEFVLRYFTFRDNWDTFRGGMMRHMDEFMATNQKLSETRLKAHVWRSPRSIVPSITGPSAPRSACRRPPPSPP